MTPNEDARYLTTLLTALVLACLLAVSLWQDTPCRGCNADINRDRLFMGHSR